MRAFFLICVASWTLSPFAMAANSDRSDLRRFLAGLPHAHEEETCFRYCRHFAPTTGPWIINAIIPDLRGEHDDSKFLLYLNLACYLAHPATEQVLGGWLHSKRKIDRMWAQEFLTELTAHPEARSAAGTHAP